MQTRRIHEDTKSVKMEKANTPRNRLTRSSAKQVTSVDDEEENLDEKTGLLSELCSGSVGLKGKELILSKNGEKANEKNPDSPMTYDKALAIINKNRVKKIDDEEFFDMFTQELNRVSEESGSDSDVVIVDDPEESEEMEPEESAKKNQPKSGNAQNAKQPSRPTGPVVTNQPIPPENYPGDFNQPIHAQHGSTINQLSHPIPAQHSHPAMQRVNFTQGALYQQFDQNMHLRGQLMYNQYAHPSSSMQDPHMFNPPIAHPDVNFSSGISSHPHPLCPVSESSFPPNNTSLKVRSVPDMNNAHSLAHKNYSNPDQAPLDVRTFERQDGKDSYLNMSSTSVAEVHNIDTVSTIPNNSDTAIRHEFSDKKVDKSRTPFLDLLGLDKKSLKLLKKVLGLNSIKRELRKRDLEWQKKCLEKSILKSELRQRGRKRDTRYRNTKRFRESDTSSIKSSSEPSSEESSLTSSAFSNGRNYGSSSENDNRKVNIENGRVYGTLKTKNKSRHQDKNESFRLKSEACHSGQESLDTVKQKNKTKFQKKPRSSAVDLNPKKTQEQKDSTKDVKGDSSVGIFVYETDMKKKDSTSSRKKKNHKKDKLENSNAAVEEQHMPEEVQEIFGNDTYVENLHTDLKTRDSVTPRKRKKHSRNKFKNNTCIDLEGNVSGGKSEKHHKNKLENNRLFSDIEFQSTFEDIEYMIRHLLPETPVTPTESLKQKEMNLKNNTSTENALYASVIGSEISELENLSVLTPLEPHSDLPYLNNSETAVMTGVNNTLTKNTHDTLSIKDKTSTFENLRDFSCSNSTKRTKDFDGSNSETELSSNTSTTPTKKHKKERVKTSRILNFERKSSLNYPKSKKDKSSSKKNYRHDEVSLKENPNKNTKQCPESAVIEVNKENSDVGESELKALKKLSIKIDWELSPLHKIDTGSCRVNTAKLREQLGSEHPRLLNEKKFTKEDESKIKKSWEEFAQTYNFNNPELFFPSVQKFGYFSHKERLNFKKCLAKYLPERRLYSVFLKFINMYGFKRKGRWSDKEDRLLLDLYQACKGDCSNDGDSEEESQRQGKLGLPMKKIMSNTLNRSVSSVNARLKILLENKNAKNLSETMSSTEDIKKKLTVRVGQNRSLKGVLVHLKSRRHKKTVSWKEDGLETVKFFELDETERVNVTKNFSDVKLMEREHERENFQLVRKLAVDDTMEEKTRWRALIPIDIAAPVVAPGKNSQEKEIQYAREKTVPAAIYFNKRMIPDAPAEPDLEIHATTNPAVIPLDDITGSTDSINDFTTTPWPEPRGPAPPPVPPPAPPAAPVPPFPPAPAPGPAFQGPPFPPMGPPGAPFMPPGPPLPPSNDCWRTGDRKLVPMPGEMMMGPPQPMMGPPGPMGPMGPPGPMMLPPGVSPEMGPFPMMGPNPSMPEEMHFAGGFPQMAPGPFPPGPPGPPVPQGPPQGWQGGGNWYDGDQQQGPLHHNQSRGNSWRGRGGRNRPRVLSYNTREGSFYGDGRVDVVVEVHAENADGSWGGGNSRMPICNNFLMKGFCRNNSCRFRHPRN